MRHTNKTAIAAALMLVGCAMTAADAVAQSGNPSAKAPSGQKLTAVQCETLWNQASGGKGSVDEAQAQPYVTTFKSVDLDGDGKVSQKEWTQGCNGGYVMNSTNTGAASGDGRSKVQPGQSAPGSKM